MASNIVTLKDATKTNELLPRTRIKAVCDDSGNYLDSALAASDINGLKNGGLAAKADKVTSPTNGDIAKLNASGNLVDSGIPATKVVQNDGYYKNLGAGTAEQLVSTVFTEDKVPYNFRTAGGAIDIGDREEDEVTGGTVAWNQLCPIKSTASVNGITFTSNGDGSYTLNGTASATAGLELISDLRGAYQGHNLLGVLNGAVSGVTLQGYSDDVGGFFNGSIGIVLMPTITSSTSFFRIRVESGTVLNNVIVIPQLFDLTQMFGTTIADHIATLETGNAGAGVAFFRKLFPKPYYAYNAGSLESVCVSAHNMTEFNQWDEEWEVGDINDTTGATSGSSDRIRSKNFIPVIPDTTYYFRQATGNGRLFYYDANKNFISAASWGVNTTRTTPANCCFVKFTTNATYGTTYNHDICINLHWDGERDGEYEPYVLNSYPLDHTKVLRGIPKLDGNNKLYFDGDVYKSSGEIERKWFEYTITGNENFDYGHWDDNSISMQYATTEHLAKHYGTAICAFYDNLQLLGNQNGTYVRWKNGTSKWASLDAFKAEAIGKKVLWELAETETETADPYTNPQIVDDFGTEEYVDYPESQGTRDVAIPVGHNTKYQPNLRAKLEMAPDSPDGDGYYAVHQDGGENEYVEISTVPVISGLTTRVPACATGTDGTFVLKATVADGAVTYAWVEEV